VQYWRMPQRREATARRSVTFADTDPEFDFTRSWTSPWLSLLRGFEAASCGDVYYAAYSDITSIPAAVCPEVNILVKDTCCEPIVEGDCSICGADPLMYPETYVLLEDVFNCTCATHQYYAATGVEECNNDILVAACCGPPPSPAPTTEDEDEGVDTTPSMSPSSAGTPSDTTPTMTTTTTPDSRPSSATMAYPSARKISTSSSLMVMFLSTATVVGTWMSN